MLMPMLNFIALLLAIVAPAGLSSQVNIVVIIGDDVGWAGVSYHNATKQTSSARPEIQTPNIDKLVKNGIDLTRHYVYRFCSPSRSSFQSGRLPVHVNTLNVAPEIRNVSEPVVGYQVRRWCSCCAGLHRVYIVNEKFLTLDSFLLFSSSSHPSLRFSSLRCSNLGDCQDNDGSRVENEICWL